MKKFTKKTVTFTHDVKGIGEIKTTCRTFGSPICKGKTTERAGTCTACTQEESVITACMVQGKKLSLKPEKKARAKKEGTGQKGGPRGPRSTPENSPYAIVVRGLHKGVSKDKIIQKMIANGVSEANAKNKYGSVSCCYNAFMGNSKRDGSIVRYAAWITAGRQGEAPQIDAGSRSYTEKTYAVMKQLEVL